jgi:hypothetical protein
MLVRHRHAEEKIVFYDEGSKNGENFDKDWEWTISFLGLKFKRSYKRRVEDKSKRVVAGFNNG